MIRCSGRLRRLALTFSDTITLVFQKRYFVDDLRMQIVRSQWGDTECNNLTLVVTHLEVQLALSDEP